MSFEEVTGVYFAIDDRLELHSLRERIAALPREERWEALARRAPWEDPQGELQPPWSFSAPLVGI